MRNEASVIARSLTSVRPFIDSWVIIDTGSTDGSQDIAKRTLSGIPGRVLQSSWKGFASSRNQALFHSRKLAEYSLFLDADDFIVASQDTLCPIGDCDVYDWWAYEGCVRHSRVALLHRRISCEWIGDIHEYLNFSDLRVSTGRINSASLHYCHDGDRGQDPLTTNRDLNVLEALASKNPNDARTLFYLAETLARSNNTDASIQAYKRRLASFSDDAEETWYCTLAIARLMESADYPRSDVMRQFAACATGRQTRAEPILALAQLLREQGDVRDALELSIHCSSMPIPDDRFFVDETAFGWRAWDEVHVCSLMLGNIQRALLAAQKALSFHAIPVDERRRIERNVATFTTRAS